MNYEFEYFNHQIKENYKKAIDFVRGSKLYGIEIDVESPEEVIAALYIYSQIKEFMVKTDV